MTFIEQVPSAIQPDANATQLPTQPPSAKVIGVTKEIDDKQFVFRPATVPELDRYLGAARKSLVTASITLALDIAPAEAREELRSIFAAKPGLAVSVANDELQARGFSQD